MALWRHRNWWRILRKKPKYLALLVFSSGLIASNWLIYVWAIYHQQILATSLGHILIPLINVLLGFAVLGERLRSMQWFAVGLALVSVMIPIASFGSIPWVSLLLACSFALYGLIRKQIAVAALPGLVVETWLLLPLALAFLWLNTVYLQQAFWQTQDWLWLVIAGPVTLIPLLLFNAVCHRLPYSTLGFLQYITPTMVLLQAVLLFDEPFERHTQISFFCIWIGLLIYSLDIRRTTEFY